MLQSVPEHFELVAISIKTLLDLSTISIQEATGQLCVAEQRKKPGSMSPKDSSRRLLLTEEEWMVRLMLKDGSSGSLSLLLKEAGEIHIEPLSPPSLTTPAPPLALAFVLAVESSPEPV